MSEENGFFVVHRDLPREGPGDAADVHWALEIAGVQPKSRVLDAACGPGADTVTLARALPDAEILAVDTHAPFIEQARNATAGFAPRVEVEVGSYLNVEGAFNFIWCAGALYFHGIETTLNAWLPHIAPGGAVAFSEPCWMIDPPSDAARAFWEGEYEVRSRDAIEREIHLAGWGILGQRWIVDEPWAAYYGPLSARLDQLEESEQSESVTQAIQQNRDEVRRWQAARGEIAYSLYVIRRS